MLSTRSERRAAERAALNAVAAAASASSSAHATSAGSSSSAASAAGHTFNFQPAKVATGHTKESDRRKQPTPSASTSSAPATTPGATH